MFATGEVVQPHPVIDELVREATDWLARPFAPGTDRLTAERYGAVDTLDDARDVIDADPAAAALLLAEAVRAITNHAFSSRGMFAPRRKATIAALAAVDAEAATLVRRWASATGRDALGLAAQLARHVLGVDTFFEWTSPREPVRTDPA
jgi:hypothetical protein